MSQEEATACSGCGLPPRKSRKTGEPLKLQRCSQCRNAWYHDVQCQRNHFPKHRKECQKQRLALAAANTKPKVASIPAYRIENREGRGRCLVATRPISVGEPIAPDGRSEFFDPLVPPVLTEDSRSSRCALCFRHLAEEPILVYDENKHSSMYPVLFCSNQCRELGKPWLEEEERAVSTVCSRMKRGATVMPTALLLYRILCKIASEESRQGMTLGPLGSTRSQVDDLQLHRDMDGTSDAQNHARAVIALAKELAICTAQNSRSANANERGILSGFTAKFMADVLSKMKTNCFSICDGESVAIGLGLFPVASNMNHSCEPNAIQTFMYGDGGSLPLLRVTACSGICENEEICVSYIDNACPRDLRRERLREGYNFWCTCPRCIDDETDNQLVGLRCPSVGCNGVGERQQANGSIQCKGAWKCDRCGETDFHLALKSMKTLISMEIPGKSLRSHSGHRDYCYELEKVLKALKSTCFNSSWYVREASERLIQGYLDNMSGCKSERETRELCSRALKVSEELLSFYENAKEIGGWAALRVNMLRYKAAKLRLFLYPDPRQALQELQDVYSVLSMYFPRKHELLIGLKLCIEQSSM